jgi:hypothetical protein
MIDVKATVCDSLCSRAPILPRVGHLPCLSSGMACVNRGGLQALFSPMPPSNTTSFFVVDNGKRRPSSGVAALRGIPRPPAQPGAGSARCPACVFLRLAAGVLPIFMAPHASLADQFGSFHASLGKAESSRANERTTTAYATRWAASLSAGLPRGSVLFWRVTRISGR